MISKQTRPRYGRHLVFPAAQRMALCTRARYDGLPNAVGPWPSWIATTRRPSSGPIQARLVSLVGLSVVKSGPDLGRHPHVLVRFVLDVKRPDPRGDRMLACRA